MDTDTVKKSKCQSLSQIQTVCRSPSPPLLYPLPRPPALWPNPPSHNVPSIATPVQHSIHYHSTTIEEHVNVSETFMPVLCPARYVPDHAPNVSALPVFTCQISFPRWRKCPDMASQRLPPDMPNTTHILHAAKRKIPPPSSYTSPCPPSRSQKTPRNCTYLASFR